MMTLGWITSRSICVYEYGSSIKCTDDRCFEFHFCKSPPKTSGGGARGGFLGLPRLSSSSIGLGTSPSFSCSSSFLSRVGVGDCALRYYLLLRGSDFSRHRRSWIGCRFGLLISFLVGAGLMLASYDTHVAFYCWINIIP